MADLGAPTEYKKLPIKQFPVRALRETAEGRFWKSFKPPVIAQQVAAVTHIDFMAAAPYHFAVTSSTRVLVYDPVTQRQRKQFSRFKDIAYGGTFRPDGKVMVAGGATGIVQVFDAGTRSILRQLRGHQRAVHAVGYASDNQRVLSGSDDTTVRLWDVPSGEMVTRLDGHSDYVRCLAASPASGDVFATGSYDHTVRLWDLRAGKEVMRMDHGAFQAEDVQVFPTGGMLVSAAGNSLYLWDLLGGGRLLRRLTNHQKAVTCVRLCESAGPAGDDGAAGPRMVSGSADGHVKVWELDTFKVVHASRYPSPVLSLGVSPDGSTLAVGMADGALSVRRRERRKGPAAGGAAGVAVGGSRRRPWVHNHTAGSWRYFIRGRSAKAAEGDHRVAARRRAHLAPYDKLLRRFRYREALDAALATQRGEVVASVLEELAARGGVPSALGGRDAEGLRPLLAHVLRHVADPRLSRLLSTVAERILDAYAPAVGADPEIDRLLRLLRERVEGEVRLQLGLLQLQGSLEPILAATLGGGGAGN